MTLQSPGQVGNHIAAVAEWSPTPSCPHGARANGAVSTRKSTLPVSRL